LRSLTFHWVDATLERLRRSTIPWLSAHERPLIVSLLLIGVALRGLLVAFSPTPFGYVWDFYHEGVRLLWGTGHLPASTDCWQCYHPPLFYLLGWPLYAFGRWTAAGATDSDAQGLRWLAGLALVSAAVTIYYGYRLLRLFRCRGTSLVVGVALLVTFPCLFISSYGAEADIVLTGILSAFIYYFARDFTTSGSVPSSVRLGVLAGLAAATKYSGLVAIVSAVILFAIRIVRGSRRLRAVRNVAIVVVLCAAVGGWKYVDNYRHYGTPLFANGTAVEGFSISGGTRLHRHYEFTTLRLRALMRVFGPRAASGALTDLPVYHSVPTTLHALAWSDMSFFSEPTRHGDPTHPYPRKHVPAGLIAVVLVLGLVPEVLAAVGFVVTLRRRLFWPLGVACVVGSSAYVWWFLSQESWGLKTKYLLFLLPAFAVYTVSGLAFLWNRAPRLSALAGVLIAALFLVANVYLLAFALG
jgi:4-amino-4-deoxy-L-arabinose transferase-like glycosyltransferase